MHAVTKRQGHSRVNLSVDELTNNVKKLVRHALTLPQNDDDDGATVLVGWDIEMKFNVDNRNKWQTGHVLSKVIINWVRNIF